MAKHIPTIGKTFNRLRIVYEYRNGKGRMRNGWVCSCGKTGESSKDSILQGRAKSCGCLQREETSKANRKHGDSTNPTYAAWRNMHLRCSGKISNSRKYVEDGITICPEWESYENFKTDMGERPNGMSLDRIDSRLGYTKENCRWASRKVQRTNQAIQSRNTSGYTGVHPCRGKWRVTIRAEGRTIVIGHYSELTEAVEARKTAEIVYYGEYFSGRYLTPETK